MCSVKMHNCICLKNSMSDSNYVQKMSAGIENIVILLKEIFYSAIAISIPNESGYNALTKNE